MMRKAAAPGPSRNRIEGISLAYSLIHPLGALAMRLQATGPAGYQGEVEVTEGSAHIERLVMTMPGLRFEMRGNRLTLHAVLPESMIPTLVGRRLGDIVAMPPCGDAGTDDAVSSIIIESADLLDDDGGRRIVLTMADTAAVRALAG
jgi:hypothetical protein